MSGCALILFPGDEPAPVVHLQAPSSSLSPPNASTSSSKNAATKKRAAREGSIEVSRPKRRLYALSDEQAEVVAAFFEEDVEAFGGERDELGA